MFFFGKVNNKREHNGHDNNIFQYCKIEDSRIIIDRKEQGEDSYDIEIVGYRNFKRVQVVICKG